MVLKLSQEAPQTLERRLAPGVKLKASVGCSAGSDNEKLSSCHFDGKKGATKQNARKYEYSTTYCYRSSLADDKLTISKHSGYFLLKDSELF